MMKKNIIIILSVITALICAFITLNFTKIISSIKKTKSDSGYEITVSPDFSNIENFDDFYNSISDNNNNDVKESENTKSDNSDNVSDTVNIKNNAPDKACVNNNSTKLVVIDAGHQKNADSNLEPIAPGASVKKPKVASGTHGITTNIPEYIVTLQVSQKLKAELISRGYTVIMTRETNDVNISNSERAQTANNSNADAFIRIHCNGVDSSSVKGALTMCQSKNNKYCGNLYSKSRALSDCVITGLCNATGAKNRGVSENDTMSGINWCKVPVTIVEMGFMTNPEEDTLLCDNSYQQKLASGIADGIDNYFK